MYNIVIKLIIKSISETNAPGKGSSWKKKGKITYIGEISGVTLKLEAMAANMEPLINLMDPEEDQVLIIEIRDASCINTKKDTVDEPKNNNAQNKLKELEFLNERMHYFEALSPNYAETEYREKNDNPLLDNFDNECE